MCTSHSLRAIYVLCSCIDVFNLVGFGWSLCTLRVVWSSGYKTSNFSRSLHEVEVSTFVNSCVDFVLSCKRGLKRNLCEVYMTCAEANKNAKTPNTTKKEKNVMVV